MYHLYSQPLPRTAAVHNFFISDDIREDLTKRSEISVMAPPPGLLLPDEIQGYHTLVPIESITTERYSGLNSIVYRATSSTDGCMYALRRIESMYKRFCGVRSIPTCTLIFSDFRLSHESAFQAIEQWSRIRHPNVVQVREAFTSRAFNDNCQPLSKHFFHY